MAIVSCGVEAIWPNDNVHYDLATTINNHPHHHGGGYAIIGMENNIP